jgi:hypothetical protein
MSILTLLTDREDAGFEQIWRLSHPTRRGGLFHPTRRGRLFHPTRRRGLFHDHTS